MREARDRIAFSLPPSSEWNAGDVIEVTDPEASGVYRIDRLEAVGEGFVEAVRVEPSIYENMLFSVSSPAIQASVATLPVWSVFLDLPLLQGDEIPGAPWVAASGSPWPGIAAVYASSDGASWSYKLGLNQRANLGLSQTVLPKAKPGLLDRGPDLIVRFSDASVSSATREALLSGANAAVIGDPVTQTWEVFQFRDAELVGDDTWALSMRLRGQRGTDGLIPLEWPIGSTVLLLDSAMAQIPDGAGWRGVSRSYRVGPARKAVDHSSYTTSEIVTQGVGLRPYRPVHIKTELNAGNISLSWIRQTRIDGELWSGADVPIGEALELYHVRVVKDDAVLREAEVTSSEWTYGLADQISDGVAAPYSIEIAQVSDRFGPGLYGKVTIDA